MDSAHQGSSVGFRMTHDDDGEVIFIPVNNRKRVKVESVDDTNWTEKPQSSAIKRVKAEPVEDDVWSKPPSQSSTMSKGTHAGLVERLAEAEAKSIELIKASQSLQARLNAQDLEILQQKIRAGNDIATIRNLQEEIANYQDAQKKLSSTIAEQGAQIESNRAMETGHAVVEAREKRAITELNDVKASVLALKAELEAEKEGRRKEVQQSQRAVDDACINIRAELSAVKRFYEEEKASHKATKATLERAKGIYRPYLKHKRPHLQGKTLAQLEQARLEDLRDFVKREGLGDSHEGDKSALAEQIYDYLQDIKTRGVSEYPF